MTTEYNMDLLGNLVSGQGGLKVNATTSTVTHAVNATNEITTHGSANPAGAPAVISDDFTTSLSGIWTQDTGTWTISSDKANVSALPGGKALLLADGDPLRATPWTTPTKRALVTVRRSRCSSSAL